MATEYIVDDSYLSYNLVGAIKRINELSDTLKITDNNDRDFITYLCGEIYDLEYYIDEFALKYSKYVTRHQLIKICKYRTILNKLNHRLHTFDLYNQTEYEFSLTEYFDKDLRDTIVGKIKYYSDEYDKFLESIGLTTLDTTQDKLLYELLN
jgi:hypothetical protein